MWRPIDSAEDWVVRSIKACLVLDPSCIEWLRSRPPTYENEMTRLKDRMTLVHCEPKGLITRLDVDIGALNWKFESAFLNSVVWLHMKLRLGIRDSISGNW